MHDLLKKAAVNNITMAVRDRPFERTLTLHKVSPLYCWDAPPPHPVVKRIKLTNLSFLEISPKLALQVYFSKSTLTLAKCTSDISKVAQENTTIFPCQCKISAHLSLSFNGQDSSGHIGFQFKDGKITSIVVDSSAARCLLPPTNL